MKKVHISIIIGVIFLGVVVFSIASKNKGNQGAAKKTSSLKKAEEALNKGQLLEAKTLYQEVMDVTEDADKLRKVQEKIEAINIKILLSPIIDGCSTEYVVKHGDALVKIARKFKTTVELIKKTNNLTSDIIRPNQKLKVNTCKFSLVIDKSQNLLFLKSKDGIIKTYIVSTGRDNSTPIGKFHIDANKLINPTWYKTGAIILPGNPENILGSRWMGLKGVSEEIGELEGYGIHGTTLPNELGKQITSGCVRMKNEDVEELFDIIPIGTEVVIID